MNELISILKKISVLNRDNGFRFTDTRRLEAIASLLKESDYKRIEAEGLFHMYSRKPLAEINEPVVLVSSHVDCEYHITECFATFEDENNLRGTFDNSITNAAIVYLMLQGNLPDNVLVAFTGDEEEDSRGALDVSRFIKKNKKDIINIFVLDVTEEGWENGADFTVENDFWDEDIGEKIIKIALGTGYDWNFIPAEVDDIPDYVPWERVIRVEAYEDESWDYDEEDIPCFSFCLPTKGEMHCNDGILARADSFKRYSEVLEKMLIKIS